MWYSNYFLCVQPEVCLEAFPTFTQIAASVRQLVIPQRFSYENVITVRMLTIPPNAKTLAVSLCVGLKVLVCHNLDSNTFYDYVSYMIFTV